MTDQEYLDLRSHVESCPHCKQLTEVLFMRIEEHKKTMEILN